MIIAIIIILIITTFIYMSILGQIDVKQKMKE